MVVVAEAVVADAEVADAELVDNAPTTEVEEPVETTDVVPADMNPEEVEVVQKIDRIANDIAEAQGEATSVPNMIPSESGKADSNDDIPNKEDEINVF